MERVQTNHWTRKRLYSFVLADMPWQDHYFSTLEALSEYALRSLAAGAHSGRELRCKLSAAPSVLKTFSRRWRRPEAVWLTWMTRDAEALAASRRENQGRERPGCLEGGPRKRRVALVSGRKTVEDAYRGTPMKCSLFQAYLRRKVSECGPEGVPGPSRRTLRRHIAACARRNQFRQSIRVLKGFAEEPETLDALEDEP